MGSSSPSSPKAPEGLPASFPSPSCVITTNTASSSSGSDKQADSSAEISSTFHPLTGPLTWTPMDSCTPPTAYVSYIHSSPLPISLSSHSDLSFHTERDHASSIGVPGGIIAQMILYRPGFTCPSHRTLTLDYGVILEGSLEVTLDNGEKKALRKGDVVVQRATMHGFKNCGGEGEWAMAFFVGVWVEEEGCEVEGRKVGEDLSGFKQ